MIKKYLLYLLRWQLSTPLLAIVLIWLSGMNVTIATIISNLIGGLIFFWIDRWIFKDKKSITVTVIHRNTYTKGKAVENMTPDRAMKFLDYHLQFFVSSKDDEAALEMAKEALRKTIPKKPEKMDELSHRIFYQCSVCKLHIYHDDKYCRHCGQAIDWLGV